ncbi:MAG: 4Fe-4S binding protein [Candidatus Bathyarchaeia archaeon]
MVRVLLRFRGDIVTQPVTSQVILEQGVQINILTASIDHSGGEILAEIPDQSAQRVIESFEAKGVEVKVGELIVVDKERCVDCGACFSLCPVGVITIDDEFNVNFDGGKCLGSTCGLCVDACPFRAIMLIK